MDNTKELEKWIDQYGQKLFDRALYLLSSQEDAKDLVQEVYIAAFSAMPHFQEKSAPLTWLMGILHHKVSDFYRKKYKGEPQVSLDHFFNEDHFWKDADGILKKWNTDDSSLLDNEAFNAYLEKCLEELPERWLTLVKLTYLQEKNLQRSVRKRIFQRLITGRSCNAAVCSFVNVCNLTGSEKENETPKENNTLLNFTLQ